MLTRQNIIFFPYSNRNPYQNLLAQHLRKRGVRVKAPTDRYPRLPVLTIAILAIIVRQWKPHLIHLHWHHMLFVEKNRLKMAVKSMCSLMQVLILRLLGIKLVWTVHNMTDHEKINERMEIWFNAMLARLADAIIVHCKVARKTILNSLRVKNSGKVHIIPHGNFISSLVRRHHQEPTVESGRTFHFLYFGEIREYKGVMDLVDQFEKLALPDAILTIAGKPYNRQAAVRLSERCRDNDTIRLHLGFVADQDVAAYGRAADIMVFPYREILTSGGIFLAMSLGKPIIAPRRGCIADDLDEPGSFIYDGDNDAGLRNALQSAYLSKEKLPQMGAHNYELAIQRNWSDIAQQTCRLYQTVLKPRCA